MKERFRNEAYFGLLMGVSTTQEAISAENANMMFAVESLIKYGRVVGQFTLWGDIDLYRTARYRRKDEP